MLLRFALPLLLINSCSAAAAGAAPYSGDVVLTVELMTKFEQWVGTHGKSYDSHEEKKNRMQIFANNDVLIEQHNSKEGQTATLGHNDFSDMTRDEFAAHFKLGKYAGANAKAAQEAAAGRIQKAHDEQDGFASQIRRSLLEQEEVGLPENINWIEMGGVTPVKSQGTCGSCWAFSTTGALEGAKFVKTGELVPLSEQNLLDCDHEDMGCSGGLMDNAFKFDEKGGGLCSETDYPYLAKRNDECLTNCTDVPGTIVETFIDVPPHNPMALCAALTMQPISVAIQADQFVFQFYKEGIITDDHCGARGQLDHGVLAVGYGTEIETGTSYYLVKNSWGPKWGVDGYVKIGLKSKNQYGVCAILKMASFPITK